jgi:hypothetical protein
VFAAYGCGNGAVTLVTPDAAVGAGGTTTQLQALQRSREVWESLVGSMGETYYYAEENCLINVSGPDYAVTTIQVESGAARSLGVSLLDPSMCEARVNRYNSFTPHTLPQLYAQCEQLLYRDATATEVGFDERGVLKSCIYPGDSGCLDNCGEGFYLRTLAFGMLVVP